jgi:hypothetical protein
LNNNIHCRKSKKLLLCTTILTATTTTSTFPTTTATSTIGTTTSTTHITAITSIPAADIIPTTTDTAIKAFAAITSIPTNTSDSAMAASVAVTSTNNKISNVIGIHSRTAYTQSSSDSSFQADQLTTGNDEIRKNQLKEEIPLVPAGAVRLHKCLVKSKLSPRDKTIMQPVDRNHRKTTKQPSTSVPPVTSGFKKTGDWRVMLKSGDNRTSTWNAMLVQQLPAQKSITKLDPETRKIVARHGSGRYIKNTTNLKRYHYTYGVKESAPERQALATTEGLLTPPVETHPNVQRPQRVRLKPLRYKQ